MRIEESAAKKQAKIDAGTETIVGVNKFKTDQSSSIEVLSINNVEVLKSQIVRLTSLKKNRNQEKVKESLLLLKEATLNPQLNILECAIHAAKHRATLGEISMTLEETFGRYQAKNSLISGIFMKAMTDDKLFVKATSLSQQFAEKYGRRPRIMVAKMGQDGHDRGAKIIATAFADIGFDVDISPLFQTPAEIAKQAIENDVHILGISSLAGGHKSLISKLVEELNRWEKDDIVIVVGGVIPKQDYEELYQSGVSHIFGPGTIISQSAIDILSRFLG